jgi:hypothetical protein
MADSRSRTQTKKSIFPICTPIPSFAQNLHIGNANVWTGRVVFYAKTREHGCALPHSRFQRTQCFPADYITLLVFCLLNTVKYFSQAECEILTGVQGQGKSIGIPNGTEPLGFRLFETRRPPVYLMHNCAIMITNTVRNNIIEMGYNRLATSGQNLAQVSTAFSHRSD